MVYNTVRETRRHAKRAGLEREGIRLMDCFWNSRRQNWADHLPMNVAKEFMGHADISPTAEFYSNVGKEHEARAQ